MEQWVFIHVVHFIHVGINPSGYFIHVGISSTWVFIQVGSSSKCFSSSNCNSQCEPVRMCEKVFLSLGTDRKQNYALDGYVLESLSSIPNWQVCQNRCLKNCQCLSFNFKEIATTGNCELNDANTKLAPEALKVKEGVSYYEPARSYNSENLNSQLASMSKQMLTKLPMSLATTGNCELNDANTKLAPEAHKEKEGVSYYEPARSYNSENVSIFQLEFILGPKMRILIN
ncbi:hypothetical protein OS493_002114 [Desmophyllum pertusum]|uniref:Apple domain-containing protein n=1 Tax=Desmophyllum pertusum TaxID=174260 RepID=A0A9W9Z508_9CNID|nr:hypothetical protein OS493_002114 [Desmophyllum pertusum]